MTTRLLAGALLLAASCSSNGDGEIGGVVIDVTGDLTTVESFTLRTADGTNRRFEPAPGILFHQSAPLSHLSDHLLSGEPVLVALQHP